MFHIYYFLQPLDIDIFFSVIDAVHYQCNPRIQAFFFQGWGDVMLLLLRYLDLSYLHL